ncbi:hypothetical protein [Novosphingobium sp. BL-52-GroH]|uniref:hypothetical protein n=1 Tax=Novosphingobium sp. BL-52-GroH TaxID=3349877 RepID=UPI0038510A3D
MSNEASRYARDLLRIAIDLLDDEESLTAVAMISGAIDVLERRAEPVILGRNVNWQHNAHRRGGLSNCRSCA